MRHRIIRCNGQRIAYTNTSEIPDHELRAAVRFLTHEVDLDGVVIHAKHAGPHRRSYGRAYSVIPYIANLDGLRRREWRYLVTLTDGRGSDWFVTLAHEAKHVEQFREGTKITERGPVAFAQWAADRWNA